MAPALSLQSVRLSCVGARRFRVELTVGSRISGPLRTGHAAVGPSCKGSVPLFIQRIAIQTVCVNYDDHDFLYAYIKDRA